MSGGGRSATTEIGVIYEPPRDGCPYLVVIIEAGGIKATPAASRKQARELLYQWKLEARKRGRLAEIGGKDMVG